MLLGLVAPIDGVYLCGRRTRGEPPASADGTRPRRALLPAIWIGFVDWYRAQPRRCSAQHPIARPHLHPLRRADRRTFHRSRSQQAANAADEVIEICARAEPQCPRERSIQHHRRPFGDGNVEHRGHSFWRRRQSRTSRRLTNARISDGARSIVARRRRQPDGDCFCSGDGPSERAAPAVARLTLVSIADAVMEHRWAGHARIRWPRGPGDGRGARTAAGSRLSHHQRAHADRWSTTSSPRSCPPAAPADRVLDRLAGLLVDDGEHRLQRSAHRLVLRSSRSTPRRRSSGR